MLAVQLVKPNHAQQIIMNKLTIRILLIGLGVLAGFTYWFFYSCDHGCAITSNWFLTSLFGGIFGYGISDFFIDSKKESKLKN